MNKNGIVISCLIIIFSFIGYFFLGKSIVPAGWQNITFEGINVSYPPTWSTVEMTDTMCGQDPSDPCDVIGITMRRSMDSNYSIYIGYIGSRMANAMYGNGKCKVIGKNNLSLCESEVGKDSGELNQVFNQALASVHRAY